MQRANHGTTNPFVEVHRFILNVDVNGVGMVNPHSFLSAVRRGRRGPLLCHDEWRLRCVCVCVCDWYGTIVVERCSVILFGDTTTTASGMGKENVPSSGRTCVFETEEFAFMHFGYCILNGKIREYHDLTNMSQ